MIPQINDSFHHDYNGMVICAGWLTPPLTLRGCGTTVGGALLRRMRQKLQPENTNHAVHKLQD